MRNLFVVVFSLCPMSVAMLGQPSTPPATSELEPGIIRPRAETVPPAEKHSGGIHWGSLIREWALNLAIEHTERILQESKTRNQLSGPFFRDWFSTVSAYHFGRWDDDDKFITSYLGHPFQGAVVAAIFWQNDDHVRFSDQDFHSAAYRKALLQTFAFVTFDAVQWKLGPLSEASIGNIGLPAHWWEEERYCKQLNLRCDPRTGMNDLVLNEVGGTVMTIGFQWLDKHLQKKIERQGHSRALIDTTRILTNPPQSLANILRFQRPWFRDSRH